MLSRRTGSTDSVDILGDEIAGEVHKFWVENALSTSSVGDAEMAEVRGVVKELYERRGWRSLPDSRVVLVPSPFVLMVVAGISSVYWGWKRGGGYKFDKWWSGKASANLFVDRLRTQVSAGSTMLSLSGQVVGNQVGEVCKKFALMISLPVGQAVDLLADVMISDGRIIKNVVSCLGSERLAFEVGDSVIKCTGLDVGTLSCRDWDQSEFVSRVGEITDALEGGNLKADGSACVSYYERRGISVDAVVRGRCDLSLRAKLAGFVGPWVAHPEFCVVSDRPEVLRVSEARMLHSVEGPAVRWRDGTRIYALEGVQVGSKVVDAPGDLTADLLEKMSRDQVRVSVGRAPAREQVIHALRGMDDDE